MKKNFLFLGLAFSALLFAGCNKQENAPQGEAVHVTIVANMENQTKTSIAYDGTNHVYIPSWQVGDALSVYTAAPGTTEGDNADEDVTFTVEDINSDGVAGRFEGTIAAAGTYDFYAAYPKDVNGLNNAKFKDHKVLLPPSQYPTLTSFDPASDILAGIPVLNQTVTNTSVNSIMFSFKRKTAVVKVIPSYPTEAFSGVPTNSKIAKMTIDFGTIVTGRVKWNLSTPDANLDFYSTAVGAKSNSVSAIYTTEKPDLNGGNVYLSIAPTELTNANVTVTITTEGGWILSKTFNGKTGAFEVEKVTPLSFTIDNTWTAVLPVKKNISDISGLASGYTFTNPWYIEGVVMNVAPNTTSSTGKILVIQDGRTEGCGISLLLNDKNNNTFAQGDKIKCDLLSSSISVYNGLKEVALTSDDVVTKIGTASVYEAVPIDSDDMLDYQSMYVSIAGAQTVSTTSVTISATFANTIPMETAGGNFSLYIPYGTTTLDGTDVPILNGAVKGISGVYGDTKQLYPMTASDFAGLTGARIATFGTPVFAGTMTAGTALSGCTITVPVNNISSATEYKVSVTATGAGSAGITTPFAEASVTTNAENKLVATLSGTPTTAGAVLFSIVVKDATTNAVLSTKTVAAQVRTAGAQYYVKVTSAPASWAGDYLLTNTTATYIYALKGKGAKDYGGYENLFSHFVTGSGVLSNATTDACKCTITASSTGYYSIVIGGKYLRYSGTGNYLYFDSSFTESTCEWSISIASELVTITNKGTNTRKIQFANGDRFSCYTTNQILLTLYKLAN